MCILNTWHWEQAVNDMFNYSKLDNVDFSKNLKLICN